MIQQVQTNAIKYSVAWHPKRLLLAYAGEDKSGKKDKYEGTFSIIGVSDKNK